MRQFRRLDGGDEASAQNPCVVIRRIIEDASLTRRNAEFSGSENDGRLMIFARDQPRRNGRTGRAHARHHIEPFGGEGQEVAFADPVYVTQGDGFGFQRFAPLNIPS